MHFTTSKMTVSVLCLILFVSLSPISTENILILKNSTVNITEEENLFRGSASHFSNSKRKRQNTYFIPDESYIKLNYSKIPLNSEETFPYILPQIPLRNKFSKKHKAILWKEDILTPKSSGKEKSKKEYNSDYNIDHYSNHHNKHHHQHNKKRHYHHRKKFAPYFEDSSEYGTSLVERSLLDKQDKPLNKNLKSENFLLSSKEVTFDKKKTETRSKLSLPKSNNFNTHLKNSLSSSSIQYNNEIKSTNNKYSVLFPDNLTSKERFYESESNLAELSFNEKKVQKNVAKNPNKEDFNFLKKELKQNQALKGLKQMSLTIENYYYNHSTPSSLNNDINTQKSQVKSFEESQSKFQQQKSKEIGPNISKEFKNSNEKLPLNSTNNFNSQNRLEIKEDNIPKEYIRDSSQTTAKNVSQKSKKDRNNISYQYKNFPLKIENLNFGQPKKTESLYTSSLRQEAYDRPEEEEERCYSVGDLLTVIIMTSLINLTAGVIITVAFCCLTTRGRCISGGNRLCKSSHQGVAMNQNNEDDNSGSVGCLEACLPDISYQRHIAKDISSFNHRRPFFGMSNVLQHAKAATKNEVQSHCKQYLKHNCKRRSSLSSRRSLSMEDLLLT